MLFLLLIGNCKTMIYRHLYFSLPNAKRHIQASCLCAAGANADVLCDAAFWRKL